MPSTPHNPCPSLISSPLRRLLYPSSLHGYDPCPSCIVSNILTKIEAYQAKLDSRGGIFQSASRRSRSWFDEHRRIMEGIRGAKLDGLRIADLLSTCVREYRAGGSASTVLETEEECKAAEEGILLWEEGSKALWDFPGQQYRRENDTEGMFTYFLKTEEREKIKVMLEDLEKTVLVLMENLGMEDLPEPSVVLPLGLSPAKDEEETTNATWTPEDVEQRTEDLEKVQQHSQAPLSPFPDSASPPPKSISKVKTPTASPRSEPLPRQKSVRTAQFARVFPTDQATIPYCATSSTSPGSQADMELGAQVRKSQYYMRRNPAYQPGKWASPESDSKLNTSFSGLTWEAMEKLGEELDEEEERFRREMEMEEEENGRAVVLQLFSQYPKGTLEEWY